MSCCNTPIKGILRPFGTFGYSLPCHALLDEKGDTTLISVCQKTQLLKQL